MNMIYRKNRFSPLNKTSASLKLLTTSSALALVGCGGGGSGGGSFFVQHAHARHSEHDG